MTAVKSEHAQPQLRITSSHAEAALVSVIVHMLFVILCGLIFLQPVDRSGVELVMATGDAEEFALDQVEMPDAQLVLSPSAGMPSSVVLSNVGSPFDQIKPSEFSLQSLGTANPFESTEGGSPVAGNGTGGIGDKLGGAFGKRLKEAGGADGIVQFSLIWDNYNDLDLHVITPSGQMISYIARESKCGGELDVDMNAGLSISREPVENVTWAKGRAPKGVFKVYVNYYSQRDPSQIITPFKVAIKVDNRVETLTGKIDRPGRPVLIGTFARR